MPGAANATFWMYKNFLRPETLKSISTNRRLSVWEAEIEDVDDDLESISIISSSGCVVDQDVETDDEEHDEERDEERDSRSWRYRSHD